MVLSPMVDSGGDQCSGAADSFYEEYITASIQTVPSLSDITT